MATRAMWLIQRNVNRRVILKMSFQRKTHNFVQSKELQSFSVVVPVNNLQASWWSMRLLEVEGGGGM